MLTQSSDARFWAKHCILVLVTGISVGLMGYKNMKSTYFEKIVDDVNTREVQIATAKVKQPIAENQIMTPKIQLTSYAGTSH